MNIAELLPQACKKLRRSVRLMSKDDNLQEDLLGPLGYLELLPIELLFTIFDLLPVKHLSVLTLCSKRMRNQIEIYRTTTHVHQRIAPEIKDDCAFAEAERQRKYFRELGLLIKRTTCLYPTKDRLKIMLQYVNYLKYDPKQKAEKLSLSLHCFGILVHTVIAGWDESECIFVHSVLENYSNMAKYAKKVLESLPGSCSSLEFFVRKYYRSVYLEHVPQPEKAFWLSCIFKSWPLVYKAKLLYIVFGPIRDERIDWWEMTEFVAYTNPAIMEMAHVLRLLQKIPEWSADNLITVIEELADTPDSWLQENTANLLFACGKSIAITFAGNKLVNGKIPELSSLIAYLAVVCTKHKCQIKWLIEAIDCICKLSDNEIDKMKFVQAIPETFKQMFTCYLDLVEMGTDEDREAEFRLLMEAQNGFLSAIVTRAFNTSKTNEE